MAPLQNVGEVPLPHIARVFRKRHYKQPVSSIWYLSHAGGKVKDAKRVNVSPVAVAINVLLRCVIMFCMTCGGHNFM